MSTRTCDYCNKTYTYTRTSSKFHSTSCRVQAQRHGDKIDRAISAIEIAIRDLDLLLQQNPLLHTPEYDERIKVLYALTIALDATSLTTIIKRDKLISA